MEPIIANLEKCVTNLKAITIEQLNELNKTNKTTKHIFKLPEHNEQAETDLTTLYNKLEEKCEKVELQSIEIAKWKSHAMKLDESRLHGLKLLETANGKIVELEKKLAYLESKLKSKSAKYSKLKNHLIKSNQK